MEDKAQECGDAVAVGMNENWGESCRLFFLFFMRETKAFALTTFCWFNSFDRASGSCRCDEALFPPSNSVPVRFLERIR